ncbi:hypothetical protein [Afifella aestuarii]|uniref:hypothetical protein n=1 Tax=Afifella aestuarii TaxID=1909496 RepID=UPI000FE2B379|nr:hypothetical protein [Afifella aestuarii]
MTIYCLTPHRNGVSHTIQERHPGYPMIEVGHLRPAYVPEHEGAGWVARDRLGRIYSAETAEEALAVFAHRP